jgi:hypothetical protein
MRSVVAFSVGLLLGILPLAAQAQSPAPAGQILGADQLDQLLAPIALYPDPLIALILPASTVPSDVAAAAQYLTGGGDPSQIDSQAWDPSVKALAHYPQVLEWMNANTPWTQQLGQAYIAEPRDVMQSIQQLRAKALAAGTLVSTPQEQVISEDNDIRIVPAQPSTIYVPSYDPNLVYGEEPSEPGLIDYGIAYPMGPWLDYDLDWDTFGIWIGGPWHAGWDWGHPGWRTHGPGRPWRPDPGAHFGHGGSFGVTHPASFGHPPAAPRAAPHVLAPQARAPAYRPPERGWGQAPQPHGGAFGGYSRGSDARAASQRGGQSRAFAAPTRSAPSGGGERRR